MITSTQVTIEQMAERHCTPLRGSEHALSAEICRERIGILPGWSLSETTNRIAKEFTFKDFYQTMAFVNAVAFMAHREDHHPDMEIGYGHCHIHYSTHDVGGVSENDFICAAKVEKLLST